MVGLLISLLIICLLLSLAWVILGLFPLPPAVRQVAVLVFALIAVLAIIGYLPGGLDLRGR